MRNLKKQLLAFTLAAAMVFTMVPSTTLTAYATEAGENESGSKYYVGKSPAFNFPIPESNAVEEEEEEEEELLEELPENEEALEDGISPFSLGDENGVSFVDGVYYAHVGDTFTIYNTRGGHNHVWWTNDNWWVAHPTQETSTRENTTVYCQYPGTAHITHGWNDNTHNNGWHTEQITVVVLEKTTVPANPSGQGKKVPVAVYATDGTSDFANDKAVLECLGMSYVQPDHYAPAGTIYLDESFFENKTSPYIQSDEDWDKVKQAISNIDQSTLVNGGIGNYGNKVFDYLSLAYNDKNSGAGSHNTALFDWTDGEAQGAISLIDGQNYAYHLDIHFSVNKVQFIGVLCDQNGNITSQDTIDLGSRYYLTNTNTVMPGKSADWYLKNVPDRYGINGYYTNRNLNQEFVFGNKLTTDTNVYVKLQRDKTYTVTYDLAGGMYDGKKDNIVFSNIELGTAIPKLSEDPIRADGENYEFVGWTADYGDGMSKEFASVDSISGQVTTNIKFTAKWKQLVKHGYTIKYCLNNSDYEIQKQHVVAAKDGLYEGNKVELTDSILGAPGSGFQLANEKDYYNFIISDSGANEFTLYYYGEAKLVGNSGEFTFDGKSHTVEGYTVTSEKNAVRSLMDKFPIEANGQNGSDYFENIVVKETQTRAGNYNVEIPDSAMGKISHDGRYIVAARNAGSLKINHGTTIYANITGGEWIYNGDSHEATYSFYYYENNDTTKSKILGLPEGYVDNSTIVAAAKNGATSITNAGSIEVKLQVEIDDKETTELLKKYNRLVINDTATLKVNPRQVTITAGSAEKYFDGEPLNEDSYTVAEPTENTGLLGTDKVNSVKVTGTITYPGSVNNVPSDAVFSSNNYVANYVNGKLEIKSRSTADTKYKIKLTPNGGTFDFDGEEHIVSGFSAEPATSQMSIGENIATAIGFKNTMTTMVNADGTVTVVIDGKEYTVSGLSYEQKVRNVADSTKEAAITGTAVVTDASGKDVTNEFFVDTTAKATITVNPRPITLVSADGEKQYDGTPLTKQVVSVKTGDGLKELVSGDTLDDIYAFDVTGAELLPNPTESKNNVFTYTVKDSDKANNYTVSTEYGTLRITNRTEKYPVNIQGKSLTSLYNGRAQSVFGFEGENANGSITVTVDGKNYTVSGLSSTASATNATADEGVETTITGEAVVTDELGNNVTDQFDVKSNSGLLKIEKLEITIKTDGAHKTFDGKPLTNTNSTVTGTFADGESITVTPNGSVLVPGQTVKNTYDYVAAGGFNKDNYVITDDLGDLYIDALGSGSKLRISVTANNSDENIVYDGKDHTVSGFKNTVEEKGIEYTLENGAKLYVTGLEATITEKDVNVDANGNVISYEVPVTGDGKVYIYEGVNSYEVTDQVEIIKSPGTLTINKRPITLESGSAEQTYNGQALTNSNVSVIEGSYVTGEIFNYNVTGSQTAQGFSANEFTISDNSAKQSNYAVTLKKGTLTVNSAVEKYNITITGSSDKSVVYDGKEHELSGFTLSATQSTNPIARFIATLTGSQVTVENVSISDNGDITMTVEGNQYTVSGITASVKGKDVGDYELTASSVTGYSVIDANGQNVTDKFGFTVEAGKLTINPRQITIKSNSATKPYDGTALTAVGGEVVSDIKLVDGESIVFNCTGSAVNVTGEAGIINEYTYEAGQNTKLSNYSIRQDYGKLVITPASVADATISVGNIQDVEYDGNSHAIDPEVKVGDTVLVKDTDYTVSYTNTATGADDTTNAGTVTVTVTGKGNYIGTETTSYVIKPRPIAITSDGDTKVYDGKALTKNSGHVISEKGLVGNDAIKYSCTGTITNVGSVENEYSYEFSAGMASNYSVDASAKGSLEVTKCPLGESTLTTTVTIDTINDYTYDNREHKVTPVVRLNGDIVDPGQYEVTYKNGNTNTDDCTSAGTITVTITAKDDSNFSGSIETTYVIKRRPLAIKSGDAQKPYDGNPLTEDSYILVENTSIADGDTLAVTVTGAVTVVTQQNGVDNTYSYEINDAAGNDKLGNYDVKQLYGKLVINPLSGDSRITLPIEVKGSNVIYNGLVQECTPEIITSYTIGGNTYNVTGVTAAGSGTNAGNYSLNVDVSQIKVLDTNNNDVTNQFRVDTTTKVGCFIIEKAPIYIVTDNASRPYNGSPLTASGKIVGLVNGETATVKTPSITNVGKITNECREADIVWVTASADNYRLVEANNSFGSLTVSKANATITVGNASKVYGDADTVVKPELSYVGFINPSSEVTPSIVIKNHGADAGTYEDVLSATYLLSDTAKNNYDVAVIPGDLTIEKQSVNKSDSNYRGIEATILGEVVYAGTNTFKPEPVVVAPNSNIEIAPENYTVARNGDEINVTKDNSEGVAVTIEGKNNYCGSTTVYYKIVPRKLTITAGTPAPKDYDGSPLTIAGDNYSVEAYNSNNNSGLVEGDLVESVELVGSQLVPGTSDTVASNAVIKNENYDVTANYDITYVKGKLTVNSVVNNPIKIDIWPAILDVDYDGQEHVLNALDDTIKTTVNGIEYTITGLETIITATDAGDYEKVVDQTNIKITQNIDGVETDVTNQFVVNIDTPKLTINKLNITIATDSASKKYDGKPLTNDKVTFGGDVIPEGEGFDVVVTGTQTSEGSSENTFVYSVKDGTKLSNYNVKTLPGTLTVSENINDIIIHYVGPDGNKVLDDYIGEYSTGHDFVVATPAVDGYTPNYGSVTVLGRDNITGKLEVTVVFTAIPTETNGDVDDEEQTTTIPESGAPVATTPAVIAETVVETPTIAAAVTPAGQNNNERPVVAIAEEQTPLDGRVVVDDDGNADIVTIIDEEAARAGSKESWALINLIVSVLGLLYAIYLLILLFRKNKKNDEDDEEETVKDAETEEDETVKQDIKMLKVLAIMTAVVSIIVFFMTENIKLPMVYTDKWTIFMIVLLLLELGLAFLSRKKKQDDDKDEEVEAEA